MTACVTSYLLYLIGCLLFCDKSNKRIELIYLSTMDDYVRMCNYSWGRTTLAYLYHCLSEVSLPVGRALAGKRDTAHCKKLSHLNLNFILFFLA